MHGALVVAVSLAGEQAGATWAGRAATIKSPLDIRGLIGRADECVLSIVSLETRLENLTASAFWASARNLSYQVACAKTSDTVAAFALGLTALSEARTDVEAATDFLLNSGVVDAMVSNLGVLPFLTDAGGLKLEAIWGPAAFMGIEHEQNSGAITCNGALHLLHASYTPVKQLLYLTEKILGDACFK